MAVAEAVSRPRTSPWTPARVFMAVSAVWHIPLGVAGFLYDRTFPIGAHATATGHSEHIFGIFETNGWHTLAALVLGVVSLYYAIRPRHAREAALAIGFGHVVLVIALTLWDPSTFWLASNGADQVVHSSTAVAAIATGLMTGRPRQPRAAAEARA